jgi:hypothetical protein
MNIDDIAEHIVSVHVGGPAMNVARALYPADNWIGSILLICLVENAILRDGVELLIGVGSFGPLNDCVVTVVARDREAAVATLKALLDRATLLPFCRIAISDGARWECIYPSADVRMEWLLDTERQELFSAQYRQAIEKLLREAKGETGGTK